MPDELTKEAVVRAAVRDVCDFDDAMGGHATREELLGRWMRLRARLFLTMGMAFAVATDDVEPPPTPPEPAP